MRHLEANRRGESFNSRLIGTHILCTFAFLQAVATKSFVCYTMHGDMDRSIYDRIGRYCQRGFVFLEPRQFDYRLYIDIMAHTIPEDIVVESRQIMNDDGEIDTVVITYQPRRLPFPNVDTYQLQETFTGKILSREFEQTETVSLPSNTCIPLETAD